MADEWSSKLLSYTFLKLYFVVYCYFTSKNKDIQKTIANEVGVVRNLERGQVSDNYWAMTTFLKYHTRRHIRECK